MALLWKELHTRALKNKGENDLPYLKQFSVKIPRFVKGCKCKEYWVTYVKSNPPRFGSNGEYFAWTIECHNAVNTKLNKKTITLEEAKKLY